MNVVADVHHDGSLMINKQHHNFVGRNKLPVSLRPCDFVVRRSFSSQALILIPGVSGYILAVLLFNSSRRFASSMISSRNFLLGRPFKYFLQVLLSRRSIFSTVRSRVDMRFT
jgi:hypothetical protein